MNIVVNARDAMPEGGSLLIETSLPLVEGNAAPFPEAVAGEYILLSAHDTGTGMPEETGARIFEPSRPSLWGREWGSALLWRMGSFYSLGCS